MDPIKKYIDQLKNLEASPDDGQFDQLFDKYNGGHGTATRSIVPWAMGTLLVTLSIVGLWFIKPQSYSTPSDVAAIGVNQGNIEVDETSQITESITIIEEKTTALDLENKFIDPKHNTELNSEKKVELSIPISAEKNQISTLGKTAITPSLNRLGISRAIEHAGELSEKSDNRTIPFQYSQSKIELVSKKPLESIQRKIESTQLARDLWKLPLVRRDLESLYPLTNTINVSNHFKRIELEFFNERGGQHFCSMSRAEQNKWSLGLKSSLKEDLQIFLGLSYSQMGYDYLYTNDLHSKFGHTDKFPELFSVGNRTERIGSQLKYVSVDLGIDFTLMEWKRHLLGVRLTQEIVLWQAQQFTYDLEDDEVYFYEADFTSFVMHQVKPTLNYEFKLTQRIKVQGRMTYNYSLNFIGLEREKYSGLNLGAGLSYLFR